MVTIDNTPWFVTKDVCETLDFYVKADGSVNASMAVQRGNLDQSEVCTKKIGGFRGTGILLISESGLYKLAMRSNKPEAKPFQDWVTKTVLPSIRKDGAYIMGEEKVATGEMSEDELVFKAMGILQKKVESLMAP